VPNSPPYTLVMSADTLLLISDRFKLHDTGRHPENAGRLAAIHSHLSEVGLLDDRQVVEPVPATVDDVALVHTPRYIQMIERLARSGGGQIDVDTRVARQSYDVALLTVGAAISAVDRVLDRGTLRAFALSRPPGHHALPNRGMGFCIFNAIAAAAQHAIERKGLGRVAVIDWDVHHGNGTQAIFYETDRVLYTSIHQWPLFPGTGAANETGSAQGAGYTVNVPLPPGAGDREYLQTLDEIIGPRVDEYRPELLLVSAGFDAHRDDPLAGMNVSERGFADIASRMREWADTLTEGRLVLILEGGYHQQALARSVAATIRALDGHAFVEE
jgi:acetoin utilization deacetylase AcuC-like enzyme